nr:MAG TPA: hypothetical protein [Bacteriophage sp.]
MLLSCNYSTKFYHFAFIMYPCACACTHAQAHTQGL